MQSSVLDEWVEHKVYLVLQWLGHEFSPESDDVNTGPFWLVKLGGYQFQIQRRYHGSRSLRFPIPITITGQFCVRD